MRLAEIRKKVERHLPEGWSIVDMDIMVGEGYLIEELNTDTEYVWVVLESDKHRRIVKFAKAHAWTCGPILDSFFKSMESE